MLYLRRVRCMAGRPGSFSRKPTELPARYERLFAWHLYRRCKAVREVASDLIDLWQDLGGEGLPSQKRWLCERVVYLRRRCLAYEAAVLHNANLLKASRSGR